MSENKTRSYVLRDVPLEDFLVFKRACMMENVSLRTKLIAFIKEYGGQYKKLIKEIDKMKEADVD
jgi:hypothetical protein